MRSETVSAQTLTADCTAALSTNSNRINPGQLVKHELETIFVRKLDESIAKWPAEEIGFVISARRLLLASPHCERFLEIMLLIGRTLVRNSVPLNSIKIVSVSARRS